MAKSSETKAAGTAISPKQRFISLCIDWILWGYIAYGVMYFLNYYWYTVYVDWYGTLTLPAWGWPLAVLGTLEMAGLSRALGRSLGKRALGFNLVTADGGEKPSLIQRVRRFLLWNVTLPVLPILVVLGWPLPHENTSKTQLVPVTDQISLKGRKAVFTQWGLMSLFLVGFTVWLGWLITDINVPVLVNRAPAAGRIWAQLVSPDFQYFIEPDPVFALRGLSYSILNLMVVTIFMALLATVLGAVFALPVSFAGARNIMGYNAFGWAVYGVVRGLLNVFRSIETVLWALVFAVWVGWGTPFAGVLALTVHTIAALGKLYSEQVESIDPGPLEAIVAVGGSRWQVIRYAVLPQVVPSFWAFTLYRWDINVRMSTIIALVGGGGIGDMLFYYKNEGLWSMVGAVVIVIVAVVWSMDYISGRLRERIA